ncbi:MAG: hypothetical protein K2N88_05870 [Muribaculaceae bacterium]|nr:hypothetical protein [Muribaculaceae bacterium]
MNNANVISVNPGVKTLGELNINEINLARLSRTISNTGRSTSSFKKALDFTFGIGRTTASSMSSRLLAVRTVAGSLFSAFGTLSLAGSSMIALPHLLAVSSLVLGLSLLTGLCTRIASLAAAAMAFIASYSALMSGTLDSTALLVAVSGVVFCVLGPGRYSADAYLRSGLHRIYRNMHRYDPERNADKLNFEYNAFSAVDRLR